MSTHDIPSNDMPSNDIAPNDIAPTDPQVQPSPVGDDDYDLEQDDGSAVLPDVPEPDYR